MRRRRRGNGGGEEEEEEEGVGDEEEEDEQENEEEEVVVICHWQIGANVPKDFFKRRNELLKSIKCSQINHAVTW